MTLDSIVTGVFAIVSAVTLAVIILDTIRLHRLHPGTLPGLWPFIPGVPIKQILKETKYSYIFGIIWFVGLFVRLMVLGH